MAVELATRCLDKPANAVTADERQRQLIDLHHHQLPKLADYGLITYNRSTRTFAITTAGCEALTAVTGIPQEPPTVVPTEA